MDEKKGDPILKDGKRLALDGPMTPVYFLLCVFVALPAALCVLLPLTLVSQAFLKLSAISSGGNKPTKESSPPFEDADGAELKEGGPNVTRQYDVVMFGATGFTGKMASLYLAKQYGSTVRWAIAGRRRAALEDVRTELAAVDGSLRDLPIVIADSSNLKSLHDMVISTKVVITTAGPFDKYGSDLVKLCAENGTHYCDITGETDWVRKMIDKHDSAARKTGARIVHFCGHDCVPWDLAVLALSKQLAKKGEALNKVQFYDYIRSEPSGGTLATVFHSLAARTIYKSGLGYDPLLKNAHGEKSGSKLTAANRASLGYANRIKMWVGPFVMAPVMANCVRRSNAVNNYSDNLVYSEEQVYPSFMAGAITFVLGLLLVLSIFLPPLRWLLLTTKVLPNPGEGPSEASMDDGIHDLYLFSLLLF